jgi:CBS domain-containing protein
MSTSISNRIADFLKEHEPFNFLTYDELISVCDTIKIINLEKHKSVFQVNDMLHNSFYVVYTGTIHLTVISDADEALLNKCFAGDIFGLRPFFAKNNYQMTAKAREESVLLAIPIDTFRPYVAQNSQVLNYLLESFALNSNNPSDKYNNKLIGDTFSGDFQMDTSFLQSLVYSKTPVKVLPTSKIKDVASLMTENKQNSAIVVEYKQIIGIATDTDFRSKVATGKIDLIATIDKIMSAPVVCVSENISVAEAQLIMLKNSVTHLCVTFDGTDKSELKGIISEHDLVISQSNNPGVLLKEVKRSQTGKELKLVRDKLSDIIQQSLLKNIPLTHIFGISGEITIAIVKRAVELAILEIGSPPARFAFLSIGSQGRKEQLLLTDSDNILVFEDVSPDKYREVKDYFIKLAKKTTSTLEKVGYSNCKYNHNSDNSLWCKSLTDWVKQYNNWMNTPGEISNEISSVFFDYELAFGEQKLEDSLTDLIFNNAKNNVLFFDYLGNDAINKPSPLNFFKKFTTEEDGPHKGKFDIKTKAIMPLVDGARMMCLNLNIRGINNTFMRYKQLAINDPKFSEVYLNCSESFILLSKFRTQEGIKNDNDGQFINLDELSKSDKEKLKESFEALEQLEDLIKDRFKLTHFS